MNKYLKLIALLMAFSLLLTAFIACDSDSGNKNNDESSFNNNESNSDDTLPDENNKQPSASPILADLDNDGTDDEILITLADEQKTSATIVKKGAQTQITKPKTKSSIRTLILPPDMLDILAVHKKTASCEWVFPSPVKEGEPRNPDSIYGKFQKILKRAQCKKIRFHDLRHTFATMALENGMDIKTLSAMIGHISAETTLNIYSHITDTMQQQAAVRIDREIGGTDAEIPEFTQSVEPPKASEPTPAKATPEKEFEPYKGKIRKSGTGCVTMINDHLYEGRFTPRVNGKRISKNVYAKTREECEEKLAELIVEMKAEIAEIKKQAKNA